MSSVSGVSAPVSELRRLLDRETALVVRRLRGFTAARYAAAAPPFASRAAVARHLAEALTVAGQGVESAAAPEPPRWRRLPDLPVLALADMVAVTGQDLVRALEPPPPAVWTPEGRRTAAEVAASLLAEVLLHRRDLDGSPPGAEAAAAVLAVLEPARPGTPRELLAAAAARCAAYRPWRD